MILEGKNSISAIGNTMVEVDSTGTSVKHNMDSIDKMSKKTVSRLEEIENSISELKNQSFQLSQTASFLREMARNQEVVFSQVNVD